MSISTQDLKVIQGGNKKQISLKAIGQDPLVRRFFVYVKKNNLRQQAHDILAAKLQKKSY